MANAASAAETVDHTKSVANMDEFDTGLDPAAVEMVNSAVYFSNNLDEVDLEEMDFDFEVTDEVEERYSEMLAGDVEDVLSMHGTEFEQFGLDEIDLEELEAAAEQRQFDQEQIKTVVELDSKVNSIAEASDAETPVVEGHVACSAVAACVAVAVVAVVAAAVGATVAAAVNTTVTTGSY